MVDEPTAGLLATNAIARLLGAGAADGHHVEEAVEAASGLLPEPARRIFAESGLAGLADAILLEGQFGDAHFELSASRRLYYRARPFLPAAARSLLRRGVVSRTRNPRALRWPIEDSFVSFAEQTRALLEASLGMHAAPWWPGGSDFAVVLTHDVEGPFGLSHLEDLLAVERDRGFRSSVSLVGNSYSVPESLVQELHSAGFEIALHGWRHDGRLFASHARFQEALPKMNRRLKEWDAVGFRSPMTHRNPRWMQNLEIAWDASFFDTDPFEPMPGGVMSIWPYVIGRFVELPYTLAQDHTLIETLGETTPRMWLEKLDYIAAHHGMALINTHPDYLYRDGRLAMYEEFLDELKGRSNYWHALPREVAAWTQARWEGHASEWEAKKHARPIR